MKADAVRVDPAVPATRNELDHDDCSCGHDGCTGRNAFVRAPCHTAAGLVAIYVPHTGQLLLACCVCGAGVARIQVAWTVPT